MYLLSLSLPDQQGLLTKKKLYKEHSTLLLSRTHRVRISMCGHGKVPCRKSCACGNREKPPLFTVLDHCNARLGHLWSPNGDVFPLFCPHSKKAQSPIFIVKKRSAFYLKTCIAHKRTPSWGKRCLMCT